MPDKKKYELEYIIRSSPKILYNRLSTPDGLAQWFADDVNVDIDEYIFIWDGNEQHAKLINKKPDKSITFHWLDEDDDSFFEFRIEIDDITSDVALIVTDFAEEDEMDEAKLLWDSQVNNLMRLIGS